MPEESKKDQERLAKLWDAYEAQEKEYESVLKKISVLEAKIKEKDRINETLRKVVEARDQELRELEIKSTALEQALARTEPKVDELTRTHKLEKERYGKLFAIAEELEEELAVARKEIEARDQWYKRNISVMENLSGSIKDRSLLIESAKNLRDSERPMSIAGLKPIEGEATFEKVSEDSEGETEVKFETVTAEAGDTSVSSPEDFMDTLLSIPGMDRPRGEALQTAGFGTLEKIKNSTTRELCEVEGVSPTLARKIKTELFDME
jgi:DNA repair exonuclease SbcCD ATPase subunit